MIGNAKIFSRRNMLHRSLSLINSIVVVLFTFCSIFSAMTSNSVVWAFVQLIALAMFVTSFLMFHSIILSNKESVDGEIYAKAGVIYVLMLVGSFPVLLLTYTHGNPSILSEYGISSLGALATFSNLTIPISIIFFISLCFWSEVVFSINENDLYIKCNELKKSILE